MKDKSKMIYEQKNSGDAPNYPAHVNSDLMSNYNSLLRESKLRLYNSKTRKATYAGMLVTIRDELYGGEWPRMTKDLENRLNEKPFIFKIPGKIKSDLKAIERMQHFEESRKINLRDILTLFKKYYDN